MRGQPSLLVDSGADFSPCGKFRYRLWRTWDAALPVLVFLMLNPSTADALANDATVTRCINRAMALGYGGVIVVNIFALRSTNPKALRVRESLATQLAVGVDNDATILKECDGRRVICAWGAHGRLFGRGTAVLRLLKAGGVQTECLAVNADGTPKHPLYVGNDVEPIPYAV